MRAYDWNLLRRDQQFLIVVTPTPSEAEAERGCPTLALLARVGDFELALESRTLNFRFHFSNPSNNRERWAALQLTFSLTSFSIAPTVDLYSKENTWHT
jgi:hypothetical protein